MLSKMDKNFPLQKWFLSCDLLSLRPNYSCTMTILNGHLAQRLLGFFQSVFRLISWLKPIFEMRVSVIFRRWARSVKPINVGLFGLQQYDNPITTLLVLPFYKLFWKEAFYRESWLALLFSLLCSKLKSESLVFCNFLMRKYDTVWKIRAFTLKIYQKYIFPTKFREINFSSTSVNSFHEISLYYILRGKFWFSYTVSKRKMHKISFRPIILRRHRCDAFFFGI